MTYRTTVVMLLIVCLLGGLLWVMQRTVEPTARRLAESGRVLDIDLMRVEGMTVQNGEVEMDMVRRGTQWWMVRPVEARADEARIGRLLSESEALVSTETITREQREHRGLSLGDYGLDIPRTSLTFRTPLGTRRLLIGHAARLGEQAYMRIDGQSDVLLADGALREALPESIEAMRDRALLHGQPARVTRLEIERPGGGFVQLLRSAEGWVMQQPVREPAAADVITDLLEALHAATIKAFVWDPPAGAVPAASDAMALVAVPAAPVESYGLATDAAPARLLLWEAGQDVGRELVFGKPADADGKTVYAMFTDAGAVFTLDADLLRRCQVSVAELRCHMLVRLEPQQVRYLAVQQGDRKLTLALTAAGLWSILEPIQWPADKEAVTDVLATLTHARIQAFVDAPVTNAPATDDRPALRITLDSTYPPSGGAAASAGGEAGAAKREGPPTACELVAVADGTNDLMLVQVKGRSGRFQVRRDALVFLPETTALPLAFFDRTVLAIGPEQVNRITVHRGSIDQALERDGTGAWRAIQPAQGVPDAQALSEILFRVSNLRAERVADHNPGALAHYGLDQPPASLTIGLAGGEAIQKIILIGAPDGAGGCYAMIQGQDVVFVLGQDTVDSLLHGLVLESDES